jgi:predicted DNA-binding protein YlxM (UPF0122 family)
LHWYEEWRIPKEFDRRRKLTESQKVEIKRLYTTGLYSLRKLGDKFGVSRTTVNQLTNQHLAEAVRARAKAHWKDYSLKGEARAAVDREHRQYKRKLYIEGKLEK